MKFAALIAAAITIAAPAMAQPTTWTTFNQTGGQLNHWGYDPSGNVWSGTTTQMGNQTINRFRSPSRRQGVVHRHAERPKRVSSHLRGRAYDPTWTALLLRASDTGFISEAELEAARRDLTPEQYEQEYACSLRRSDPRIVLRPEIAEAEAEGRIAVRRHSQRRNN